MCSDLRLDQHVHSQLGPVAAGRVQQLAVGATEHIGRDRLA